MNTTTNAMNTTTKATYNAFKAGHWYNAPMAAAMTLLLFPFIILGCAVIGLAKEVLSK